LFRVSALLVKSKQGHLKKLGEQKKISANARKKKKFFLKPAKNKIFISAVFEHQLSKPPNKKTEREELDFCREQRARYAPSIPTLPPPLPLSG
jgi:hypothetical protein